VPVATLPPAATPASKPSTTVTPASSTSSAP
jgi:hypothetical protein